MAQRKKFFRDPLEGETEILGSSKKRKGLKMGIEIKLPKEINQKREEHIKGFPKVLFPEKVK